MLGVGVNGTGGALGIKTVKYMGSKKAMLQNGLGELLKAESIRSGRVVDLFCGGASVSWFAASNLNRQVLAHDLQEYAVVLARAVVGRTQPLDKSALQHGWLRSAKRTRALFRAWKPATNLEHSGADAMRWQEAAQQLCADSIVHSDQHVTRSYGGYYFSPVQALTFDALIRRLPKSGPERDVCLASTIIAASQCAASPGHTAQPFKANETAGKYLLEAWRRDPLEYVSRALDNLCPLFAAVRGEAMVCDANVAAVSLREGDLVFVDPPYSGVHYSRFYHVLETIAHGKCGVVTGSGRYPPASDRPNSAFSRKGMSAQAMDELLGTLAARGCNVVLTFPRERCSNGLSGEEIESMASKRFLVQTKYVKSRFSTLGGAKGTKRGARKLSDELILVLHPR